MTVQKGGSHRVLHPGSAAFSEEPTYLGYLNVTVLAEFQKRVRQREPEARAVAGQFAQAISEHRHNGENAAPPGGRHWCDSSDDP